MSKPIKATARIRVTLEITPGDHWGSDTQIDQVMKQAKESAIDLMNRWFFDRRPLTDADLDRLHASVKLFGEPQVIAVLVEEGEA